MDMSRIILLCALFPAFCAVEIEVAMDGISSGPVGGEPLNPLRNYYESDTATIEFNKDLKSRPHPYVQITPGVRSSACAAKFRSLSSRKIDMWWDNGADGVFSGTLRPSETITANTYAGHVFYFTLHKNKSYEIDRVTIDPDTVYYHIFDDEAPGNGDDVDITKAEVAFGEKYFRETGRKWRQYFGKQGPRPPPVLHMWPADTVGQVHGVITSHSYWNCDGPESICQDAEELELSIEVLSTAPKLFIIENFLNSFEADALVAQAQVADAIDSTGSIKGSIPTATRYWVTRSASEITDTIAFRAADVLGIDESILVNSKSAEDFQVLHYAVGQKFDNHHDWGVKDYYESRFVTMLLYLTAQESVSDGGETSFPKAHNGTQEIRIKPVKGTAILFYNLLEDGNGDDLAVHAALPVLNGEKWLANYWVWDPKRFSNCESGTGSLSAP